MIRILLTLCLIMPFAAQAADALDIPSGIHSFVPDKFNLIMLEKADLDGDGGEDMLIVLEPDYATTDEAEQGKRQLKILTGQKDGTYKISAVSDKAIFCESCGGIFGDPLAGIEAGTKTFTIHHYGGSNWRWAYDYQFNYSRIDKAWQLVKSTESSFHTSEPDNVEEAIYAPKDFGKIDLVDFDPETYLPTKKTE